MKEDKEVLQKKPHTLDELQKFISQVFIDIAANLNLYQCQVQVHEMLQC